jgi:hypothetical protein
MTDTPQDGFCPEPTVYHLTFADHPDVAGLKVRLRSMSIGERLEFDRLRFTPPADLEARLKKERAIAQALADRLLSWNLLDSTTKQPVPLTLDGVLSQEDRVINPIAAAWIDAITGRRAPLDRTQTPTTTNGSESLMASIPAQPLTPEPTTSA